MPSTSGGISNSKVVPSSVLPASQHAYELDEQAEHNKKRTTIAEVTPLNPETLLNWSSPSSPAHQRSRHTHHLPQSIVNLNYNFYHHYHHRDSHRPRNNFASPSRDDMSFNYHPLSQETAPSTPSINFSQSALVNALMTSPKKYYTNPSSSPQKHNKNYVSSSRGSVNGGDSGSIELEWDDYDQTQIKDEFDFIDDDDDDNYRERRRGDNHHHETEVSVIDPLRRSPAEPENSITKF